MFEFGPNVLEARLGVNQGLGLSLDEKERYRAWVDIEVVETESNFQLLSFYTSAKLEANKTLLEAR